MRLFVALDIDDAVRQTISRFLDGVREFAPDGRWVRPESLHITLKFIGEQPDDAVGGIKQALSGIEGAPLQIKFRGFGFFPTVPSARVFWLGMESGPELAELATKIDRAMEPLGVEREVRAYSPHLTLARGESRSGAPGRRKGERPNKVFVQLRERLAEMPPLEFGTMTAREFFLYQSKLQRSGAQYTKISRWELRGQSN